MTSKRKAALAKAQKASALARKGKGKVSKAVARKQAISKTNKLNLQRTTDYQKRVSKANFKGKAGRKLRKATYKDRLASSRAKYKAESFGSKVRQGALGYGGTGITRRVYKDLTRGENIRRNIRRNVLVASPAVAASAGYSAYQQNQMRKARNAAKKRKPNV